MATPTDHPNGWPWRRLVLALCFAIFVEIVLPLACLAIVIYAVVRG